MNTNETKLVICLLKKTIRREAKFETNHSTTKRKAVSFKLQIDTSILFICIKIFLPYEYSVIKNYKAVMRTEVKSQNYKQKVVYAQLKRTSLLFKKIDAKKK